MSELKMEWDKKELEIFKNLQDQIKLFDSKASILLGCFSIIFALVSTFFSIYHAQIFDLKSDWKYIVCTILIVFSCLFCIFSIISFVLVITPRKKEITTKTPSTMYYLDILEISNKLKRTISNDNLIEQIYTLSTICCKKHMWLKIGIISLIPFFVFLTIFVIICFV